MDTKISNFIDPCSVLTLVPAAVFWRRLQAAGGDFTPRHILSYRAHSNKIPTAIPIFSGSNFLMVPLLVLRDVDIHQKSKMAVAKMKCTYFTAVWLMKDNFSHSVSEFKYPRTQGKQNDNIWNMPTPDS